MELNMNDSSKKEERETGLSLVGGFTVSSPPET
jgi:hypothetical protein